MNYEEEYIRKTRRSAEMFAESAKLHVRGVSHNIRYYEPYPFVVRSSSGSQLLDVDGNSYTDYWMGHWSLVLGHRPRSIAQALHEQIDYGWMYGTVNQQTLKLSKLIADSVPAAEKIRYTASGTEATMYAARLARSHTGRNVVAKIDGGWHGYASDLLKSVNWPFDGSESTGLVGDERIVSVPYNDLEGTVGILAEHRDDLAGIIVEPVLGGGGCIPATGEYLAGVQEFVHGCDSLFILDEIVTGFRFRYGCLYPTMSLDPDVVTLGKIVGGGMPIGVICGTEEVMSNADDTRLERSYVGGGTFSANPASMIAGSSTLAYLKNNDGVIYPKINGMGHRAREGLAGAFGDKAVVSGAGSLFMVHFARSGSPLRTEITNATQAAMCDRGLLYKYNLKMIAQDGIFVLPGKLGAISGEHDVSDVDKMIGSAEEFRRNEMGAGA